MCTCPLLRLCPAYLSVYVCMPASVVFGSDAIDGYDVALRTHSYRNDGSPNSEPVIALADVTVRWTHIATKETVSIPASHSNTDNMACVEKAFDVPKRKKNLVY